jgi:hypothetical protein
MIRFRREVKSNADITELIPAEAFAVMATFDGLVLNA